MEAWNRWRRKYPEIKPDLAGADLRGKMLDRIDLSQASLRNANLVWARLGKSNLDDADLSDAS